MRINNIEYDLNSLLKRHSANSVEAARELREATGITLKEAFEILEKYEKGIINNNSEIKTSSSKFSLIPSSITSKILLAFLIPSCVILIVVFCTLFNPKKTNTNSTTKTIQKQSITEPLTQQQKTTNAATITVTQKTTAQKSTTQTQKTTNVPAPTVEHRTGENIIGISDKSVSGISFSVSKVQNDVTGNWRISTIAENIDIEYYALDYVKHYLHNKSQVHAIVNFTRNTTTSIKKYGNIIYIDIYDYVKGEEHDANRLFTGTLLQQYFVYIDNGDIEEVY